jgi:hypothetical protein
LANTAVSMKLFAGGARKVNFASGCTNENRALVMPVR